MFNSQTNSANKASSVPPAGQSPKQSVWKSVKNAAKTATSAAKTATSVAKTAAQSTYKTSGNVASVLKQATSSVSETKYLKSQTKIDAAFDLKSPDSENYKFNINESDVKQGKGVDPRLFSCLVHVSCENAKVLKEKLQNHICSANQEHNQLDILLKEINQTLQKINNLSNGKYTLEFKNLSQEFIKTTQKIDQMRFNQRSKDIMLEGNLQIPVFITIKGFKDINEAKIVKISPSVGKFTISYTDAKGKVQTLSGIEFGKLCVGSGEGLHSTDPAKGCDLPNVDCPLQGGKRKTSKKGSKSKKSKKMVGGGNDVDSISTNSLC
jgi:hypothetical protein